MKSIFKAIALGAALFSTASLPACGPWGCGDGYYGDGYYYGDYYYPVYGYGYDYGYPSYGYYYSYPSYGYSYGYPAGYYYGSPTNYGYYQEGMQNRGMYMQGGNMNQPNMKNQPSNMNQGNMNRGNMNQAPQTNNPGYQQGNYTNPGYQNQGPQGMMFNPNQNRNTSYADSASGTSQEAQGMNWYGNQPASDQGQGSFTQSNFSQQQGAFQDQNPLIERVREALMSHNINARAIQVTSTPDGNVVLRGFVLTKDQKDNAGDAARNVPGVNNVKNDLSVQQQNQ